MRESASRQENESPARTVSKPSPSVAGRIGAQPRQSVGVVLGEADDKGFADFPAQSGKSVSVAGGDDGDKRASDLRCGQFDPFAVTKPDVRRCTSSDFSMPVSQRRLRRPMGFDRAGVHGLACRANRSRNDRASA
ncbi:hypothetical protein SNE510_72820 [Streptomyces sp. NE5-10]|nr:hypothetical protein SNE510_72820 [Streptomyces sp. NE5-10]